MSEKATIFLPVCMANPVLSRPPYPPISALYSTYSAADGVSAAARATRTSTGVALVLTMLKLQYATVLQVLYILLLNHHRLI